MTTATLKARSLAPGLTVNDLQQSIRFYTEGLGFAVSEEMKEEGELRGVILDAGGLLLMLGQDDWKKGRNRVKGVGFRLYLETDQDLAALARQATSAGLTLDTELGPLPWGPMGFTLTDPDGFKLTIANPN